MLSRAAAFKRVVDEKAEPGRGSYSVPACKLPSTNTASAETGSQRTPSEASQGKA